MATIKSYTDIEQSKNLAKFLPLESADMYYLVKRSDCRVNWEEAAKDDTNVILFTKKVMSGNQSDYRLPCWSLAALLDVLDYPQLSKNKLGSGKDGWIVSVYPNDCRYDSCWHDNPIDACYEMILKLHELKML